MTSNTPLPSLADVGPAEWAALAQRHIFFGHQSVGGNVMAGVAQLLGEHPGIRVDVIESREIDPKRPAFYHALVGRNEHPIEKLDDFVALASAGFGSEGGFAMVKLCYVDAHRHTDPGALFGEYQRRIATLQARNPALRIVHVTMPLTIVENWKGRLMATVRGFVTQRERNIVRHRYNELLRAAYVGKEPVFDLARLETMRPDGTPASFGSDGRRIPMLATELTDDGGHLNAQARRLVAEQLLISLARW